MPAFFGKVTRMNARCAALVFATAIVIASCSQKPKTETESRENESQPREDEIAEDCVTFVRATKVVPAQTPGADCPGCSEGAEVFTFRQMHTDQISCSTAACEATVTLQVSFNPETKGTIGGGLTAWIPPEERQEFLNGHAPAGEQVYRVKIVYKRTGEEWKAIEFDRAD